MNWIVTYIWLLCVCDENIIILFLMRDLGILLDCELKRSFSGATIFYNNKKNNLMNKKTVAMRHHTFHCILWRYLLFCYRYSDVDIVSLQVNTCSRCSQRGFPLVQYYLLKWAGNNTLISGKRLLDEMTRLVHDLAHLLFII